MDDLARRAVRCAAWRWMPGMLTQHGRICGAGYLVSDDVDEGGQPYVDCTDTIEDWSGLLPALTDPATVGCLLTLVREAWGDPYLYALCAADDFFTVSRAGTGGGHWLEPMIEAPTEAAALVAALEAAP